jgi:hypothetical protein
LSDQKLGSFEELRQLERGKQLAVWRRTALVLWGYSFAIWLYVTGFQIVHPESVLWQLAVWLPWIRLDYFGEAGFIASFAFALAWIKLK